jgi:hypothetical protein
MEAAAAIAPAQSIYHALVGILSIELGEPVRARAALDRAIALGHPDEERVASFYLWRARAADLDGRRVEARADYAVCSTRRADPPVAAAARGGLERPYTARRARRIQVEMSLGDVMAP